MIEFTNPTMLCLSAVLVLLMSLLVYKRRNLPPGPTGFPFIGYFPFLSSNTCHHQLLEMKKKYGDVSSFTITGHLYVNLGTVKAAREALLAKSDCFGIRVRDYNILEYSFQGGVAFTNGEEWKILRKFFLQQLRERSFNSFKESMCGPIYDILKDNIKYLAHTNGKPVDIVELISERCTHVLRHTVFGEDGITTQELKDVNKSYEIVLENMTGPNLLLVGTFAKYFIIPFTHGFKRAMEHNGEIQRIVRTIVERRKSTFNEANVRDVIDMYFKERNERQARGDPTALLFTDKALSGTLFQIIGDGILTVAIFISAFFRALLDHPEEQEKIYKELVDVVGLNRDPTIEDKNKLPYTNAFIMEVERTCEIFPFFPDLECTKETTVQGYRVPKGAILLLNSWAAHHDPMEYEEPNKFNPSRFIVEKGKKRPEAPILFGLGKRACIGEGFAISQAFLFLTTIVKHFRLSQPTDAKDKLLFLVGSLEVCAHARDTNQNVD